jgi:hypothetical protein
MTYVMIKDGWARVYRKPGAPLAGRVVAVSPTGDLVRVRMDDVGDSYVRREHVESLHSEPPNHPPRSRATT